MAASDYEKIKAMPKIELHAHLSGSIRESTIFELLQKRNDESSKNNDNDDWKLVNPFYNRQKTDRTLDECFRLFPIIHRVLSSKQVLERVTREIIEDFEAENCAYLELRTTPRSIRDECDSAAIVLSKEDYLTTVIDVIREHETAKPNGLIIRLLISIDRSKGVQEAYDTIELCKRFIDNKHVVGIDFSGNPNSISFREFEKIFETIKQHKWKFTVHIGEIWNDPDFSYIVDHVRPDRLGHSVCLSDEMKQQLIKSVDPIPIEICPTSNMKTLSMESLSHHPFKDLYFSTLASKSGYDRYPLCICTDDACVFQTNLTKENHLIAETFHLKLRDLFDINAGSVSFIFDQTDSTHNKLNRLFEQFKIENNSYFS